MADLISRAEALDAIDCERKLLIERNQLGAEHIVVHHARRQIEELPAVDAIPVEWLREKMRGYASSLKSTETAALVMVMQMWQKEQEAR